MSGLKTATAVHDGQHREGGHVQQEDSQGHGGRFGDSLLPSARWTAQLVREAFPYDTVPRYLLRDRDRIFGTDFVRRVESMGIEEIVTAEGSLPDLPPSQG
jgi:hypothetical protein